MANTKLGTLLSFSDLLFYTDWEREQWLHWFRRHGSDALTASVGQNGSGRFNTVGEVIRHIFSAEKRYVDRLAGRPLTDTSQIAAHDCESLFAFGAASRQSLNELLETYPPEQWDSPQEIKLGQSAIYPTARKILIHIVLHEIRHWAQVAVFVRQHGLPGEFRDFLFTPDNASVSGTEMREARSGN